MDTFQSVLEDKINNYKDKALLDIISNSKNEFEIIDCMLQLSNIEYRKKILMAIDTPILRELMMKSLTNDENVLKKIQFLVLEYQATVSKITSFTQSDYNNTNDDELNQRLYDQIKHYKSDIEIKHKLK